MRGRSDEIIGRSPSEEPFVYSHLFSFTQQKHRGGLAAAGTSSIRWQSLFIGSIFKPNLPREHLLRAERTQNFDEVSWLFDYLRDLCLPVTRSSSLFRLWFVVSLRLPSLLSAP